MELIDIFREPPSPYRGKPFWAWNGKLEEGELRRQIRVFKEMGLGGGFMHSRVGLATPYLSDEWFALVRACCDEAKKQGLEAWLYDEDRWPSVAAGGLVTKDPRFRQRQLVLEICDPEDFTPNGDELTIFLAAVGGDMADNIRPFIEDVTICHEDKVLAFYSRAAQPSAWYNEQTYLDTLSAAAVQRFVEVTHQAYGREVLAQYDGAVVPGIFSDEPNHGRMSFAYDGGAAPWTDCLPEVFQERYGYDILEFLPELMFVVEGEVFAQLRRDYHDCLSYLFCQNFVKQIGDWCEANDQLMTGHALEESTLARQTAVSGSAMRIYEHMQAPGIDIIAGQGLTRPGGSPPEYATAKQCSSVKHQFGRQWMLSEMYGATGWHFTFAEHKAVGDWQAALGVNLRCHHLSWYTMLGQAKRDYPASVSFQSPWRRDYPVVEDYFARINVMLTQGDAVRDLAVIHPIESVWAYYHGHQSAIVERLDNKFEQLQQWLLEEHFDFDYIDEDILARHGAVVDDALQVAKARYRTVLAPPMDTMRQSTLEFLQKFQAAGGHVIFVEPIADRVDCQYSGAAAELARDCIKVPFDHGELWAALEADGKLRRVSIQNSDGHEFHPSLYMLRQDAAGRYVAFVCRTDQEPHATRLTIVMSGQGQVQEWDASTGERYQIEAAAEAGEGGALVRFQTELAGTGSRVFVVDPEPDPDLSTRPVLAEQRRRELGCGGLHISRDEPNAFPLDYAAYSIDDGLWAEPTEILRIDDDVRDFLGAPRRGGRMVQPWAREEQAHMPKAKVLLRYNFRLDHIPADPCHLVLERPADFTIRLNDRLLPSDSDGWWIDNSFERVPVPVEHLCEGRNQLLLETECDANSAGLESVYFTGEFGFHWDNLEPVVTGLPTELRIGDWTEQGFPCYTGAITYNLPFEADPGADERVFLEIPKWEGVLLKVAVNGEVLGAVAWPPYEIDVTDALSGGQESLQLTVVSSRRNLLGPLHCTEKYPSWTGPEQFTSQDDCWTDEYVCLPYGLTGEPALSFRA